MEVRYSNNPEDSKFYTTEELRRHYLVEKVFVPGELKLTYSHADRIIFGGAVPMEESIKLDADKKLGTDYFLERRELGVINLGGTGIITLDGKEYELQKHDGLYAGAGIKEVKFYSKDKNYPAKFYINSAPAHTSYPTVKIEISKANPVKLGSMETSNKRTIYQYVHPNVCKSCQLVMGMTILETGCVWNTMPCHTHDRRMEVYFYFDMDSNNRVFHLMGEPDQTRHIVVANEQAVISPSWSIHSGVGTGSYTFIWGMAGENQVFDDMDLINTADLK